jgi:hypothetical protein
MAKQIATMANPTNFRLKLLNLLFRGRENRNSNNILFETIDTIPDQISPKNRAISETTI